MIDSEGGCEEHGKTTKRMAEIFSGHGGQRVARPRLAIHFPGVRGASRAQDAELSRKLTLKEAVNLAVANSRDLALARLQYGVMQRQIGVARSVFLPNLYTGTGVAYTSGFPLLEGGGAPAIFTLSYNQQIFNPPLKGEQHAAEQRAEEQRLSIDDVRDAVMSRAALDYLELAKVRHALELMHGERTSAGRILDATRERAGLQDASFPSM